MWCGKSCRNQFFHSRTAGLGNKSGGGKAIDRKPHIIFHRPRLYVVIESKSNDFSETNSRKLSSIFGRIKTKRVSELKKSVKYADVETGYFVTSSIFVSKCVPYATL
jgi:hypothetical protein